MKQFRRTLLLAACLVLPALPRPAIAQATGADMPIVALDAALIEAMKAGHAVPFQKRYDGLAPVVERAFDLRSILETSVGLRWKDLPADQQSALLASFTRFTVASFVANFDSYSGQKIELAGARAAGSDQIVQTQIMSTDGNPKRIDYVMRQSPSGWHAVDVLLDGSISNAAVMRSDFRRLLSGGSAAPLIKHLDDKSAELAAGTKN